MSVWRRKAIECIPELRQEFEDADTTIYGVFSAMLPVVVEAHRSRNSAMLERCYDFAEWCLSQTAADLWNAAGVSFYEHLADYSETLAAIPRWVNPSVYATVRDLLKARLSLEDFGQLDNSYRLRGIVR